MFNFVDPVTYFQRKRERASAQLQEQEGKGEREDEGGGGGWCSIQRAINRAVSGGAELNGGDGRRGNAGEEDEAVGWDEGFSVYIVVEQLWCAQ